MDVQILEGSTTNEKDSTFHYAIKYIVAPFARLHALCSV